MPVFNYEVIDQDGEEQTGTIEAATREEAARNLRDQGFYLIGLYEEEKSSRWRKLQRRLMALDSVKGGELVIFFQLLATMMENGLTLAWSLDILKDQRFSRKLRMTIEDIKEDILDGNPLEFAMGRHRRVFSSMQVNMVGAGEKSGALPEVLRHIADSLETMNTFKRQVVTAFIYPSIVVIMSMVVVVLLVMFVLPVFIPFLKGHAGMPWATQFLIDFTEWFKLNGKRLGIQAVGFVAAFYMAGKIPVIAFWRDKFKLKIPILGMIFTSVPLVRFSQNMSVMVRSGVSLSEALPVVRDTLGNRAFAVDVEKMADSVIQGDPIVTRLKEEGATFPRIVVDLVSVGEESGSLEAMLVLVKRIYDFMLQNYIKRMNAIIEPILIAIIAGIVGFVGYALLSGVMALYGSVSGGK